MVEKIEKWNLKKKKKISESLKIIKIILNKVKIDKHAKRANIISRNNIEITII